MKNAPLEFRPGFTTVFLSYFDWVIIEFRYTGSVKLSAIKRPVLFDWICSSNICICTRPFLVDLCSGSRYLSRYVEVDSHPPPAIFLLLEFAGDVLASQHVGHAIIGPVIVSRAQARQSGALPHAQFSSVDILSRREGECVLDWIDSCTVYTVQQRLKQPTTKVAPMRNDEQNSLHYPFKLVGSRFIYPQGRSKWAANKLRHKKVTKRPSVNINRCLCC